MYQFFGGGNVFLRKKKETSFTIKMTKLLHADFWFAEVQLFHYLCCIFQRMGGGGGNFSKFIQVFYIIPFLPTRIDGLDKRWIIYISTDRILKLLTNELKF